MTEILEGKEYTSLNSASHWTVAKIHQQTVLIWWVGSDGHFHSDRLRLDDAKTYWIEYKEPIVLKAWIPILKYKTAKNTMPFISGKSYVNKEHFDMLHCYEIIDWIEIEYTVKD